jgi:hypothetical protein
VSTCPTHRSILDFIIVCSRTRNAELVLLGIYHEHYRSLDFTWDYLFYCYSYLILELLFSLSVLMSVGFS